jgi:hypothetical protein
MWLHMVIPQLGTGPAAADDRDRTGDSDSRDFPLWILYGHGFC